MATRRRSTATKSAKSAPTQTVTKKPSVVTKVTKYSKPIEIKKVTETPTKERRFATSRPEKPNISLEEYISDFKLRMQINNYEVMEFLADCQRFYNTNSPHVAKLYNNLKEQVQSLGENKPAEDKKEES
tara:strand:+ start:131 stop:517 length:387 start_codon:yes stop_codon:yes gene_type:complete